MNILFISYSFSPNKGGVQRVTQLLANQLLKRGHQVFFLYGCNSGSESISLSDIPCFYMDKNISEPFGKESVSIYHKVLIDNKINAIIMQYPLLVKSDFFFKNTIKGILKISCFHGSPIGALNALRENCRQISILGNLLNSCKYLYQKMHLQSRYKSIVNISDYVCVLSPKYVNDIISLCPIVNREKFISIPNPNCFKVDTHLHYQKDNLIIFVGRVSDPVKNVKGFIDIWQQICYMQPDWSACIIGDDSGCDDYKRYIEKNDIKRISFVGHTNQISSFYEKAKIICMTSHHEGWPMVLTEAMSYGCVPCLYDTFGSASDIVLDGHSGFIVKPYCCDMFVNRLNYLIDSDDKFMQFSRNASSYIKQFSIDVIVDKWETILKK